MSLRGEAVFCDDVRQETSGKHILVGVYGGDIVPTVLPAGLPLAVWVRVYGLPIGRHRFTLKLTVPEGSHGGELSGETDVVAEGPALFAVSGLPLFITKPGPIVASIAFDGQEPIEVGQIKVTEPQKSSLSFSSRPS